MAPSRVPLLYRPAGPRLAVEQTGSYTLGSQNVVSRLTERQREVLREALERGYYRESRGATHGEIAAATGLSETTLGEHLRKVEATVFSPLRLGDTGT